MNHVDLTGQTIGQYQLRQLLGEGGMGVVYRAWDDNLEREVAFKVLLTGFDIREEYFRRFRREARTAASLEHPQIVPIYDYGTHDIGNLKISYVVMRLLTGGSLSDRLRRSYEAGEPFPSPTETGEVIRYIAAALDYAHTRGIVHRDIKPSNVMLDAHGAPFIVDFGIAKLQDSTKLTMSNNIMGTPPYMAPELWMSDEVVPATDQYALGIMAYEMLSGQFPFKAQTQFQFAHKHLHEVPISLLEYRPDLPIAINDVLMRTLAKTPTERYPSMIEFAQDFERVLKDVSPQAIYPIIKPNVDEDDDEHEILVAKALGTPTTAPKRLPDISTELLDVPQPISEDTHEITSSAESSDTLKIAHDEEYLVQPPIKPQEEFSSPLLIAKEGVYPEENVSEASQSIAPSIAVEREPDEDFFVAPEMQSQEEFGVLSKIDTEKPSIIKSQQAKRPSIVSRGKLVVTIAVVGVIILGTVGRFFYNTIILSTMLASTAHLIAFSSNRDGNFEIHIMNNDGSNPVNLTNNNGDDFSPTWSPDGTRIAFSSTRDGNYEIYIMNRDGSNPVNLTNNSALDDSPTWSPDGTHIAFSSIRDGDYEIYIMNTDGSNTANLTNNIADDYSPSWSPNGAYIAFVSDRGGDDEIYIMSTDGSNNINLTSNEANYTYSPSWSPDGDHIAFRLGLSRSAIYSMNADGSNPVRLTDNTDNFFPSWSPDGIRIGFTSDRDDNNEIYVMNADGSNQVNITNNEADDRDSTWAAINAFLFTAIDTENW